MTIQFDARDLPPYAEPVSADDLKQGEVYFFVNYVDQQMLIPTIDTVAYIGENLEAGDTDRVYFQDIDSFTEGVQYGSENDGAYAVFQCGSRNELGYVFTFEAALNELLKCSVRRKRKW